MIYKYCRRCGKRLEGKNRLIGFGKTCFEKAHAEALVPPIVPHQLTLFSSLEECESKAQSKANQKSKAKQRNKENFFSDGKSNGARPPHLEKTLTPTSQKPLLFTPPTPPPPRR